MSMLSAPYFHDEAAAYELVESIVWPNGPVCPHCENAGKMYRIAPNPGKRVRPGLIKCGKCRKQFTVKVGTVFEQSHIPMNVWLQAAYLMASSKKGVSTHQLHRTLGVTLKSAWFLTMRLREAMRVLKVEPVGGNGAIVECDEVFIGPREKNKHEVDRKHLGRGAVGKEAVVSLVERSGRVHSTHVPNVKAATLRPVLESQTAADSFLMTDEALQYRPLGKRYRFHFAVEHSIGEYVRGDIHTNTIEGYFSILKRGLVGVYQHVSARHLKRYLAEFDFRYSNRVKLGIDDATRAAKIVKGAKGKRLYYRRPSSLSLT